MNINDKANYCLNCINKPCTKGCPLENDIPTIINLIKENKYEEAYQVLCNTTVLPSICGRICPHSNQCQSKCIRGYKGDPVDIGTLESFIGDKSIKNNWNLPISKEQHNKKIAIIGSGPSGLTCAAFLKMNGYNVTIYEKHNYLGGLLRHGIPEFRLPAAILDETINKIINLGIEVRLNEELGKTISLSTLEKEYDAIFIGIGANISSNLNIKGEELNNVLGANELLEYQTIKDFTNKLVCVNGGGNVAMDVARTINKLGAKKVTIIYRRSETEMPAETKEIEDAKKEGIEFLFQTNIMSIEGTDKVQSLECIKTELVQIEGETRLSPVNIEGSNFTIKTDYLIKAIGAKPEQEIINTLNLELDNKNKIKVTENKTSNEKVFSGGDIAGEKATVAYAARSGRNAAVRIIEYLNK